VACTRTLGEGTLPGLLLRNAFWSVVAKRWNPCYNRSVFQKCVRRNPRENAAYFAEGR
jgi:hypothetical protein